MDASTLNIPKELISKTVSFDASTPISEILSAIDKYGIIVVFKGPEYYGVVDNRSIYRYGPTMKSTRISAGKLASVVPTINDSTTIDDVLLGFHKSRVKALPYTSSNRITGVIKRFTVLKILLSLKMLSDIKVNEAMTTPVIAIDSGATLSQAKSAMRANKVNRLVVLQNKRLYGIITNHDLIFSYSKKGERLPEMKNRPYGSYDAQLSAAASKNLVVVDYSKNLADAARSMIENDVSSVIVVRKGAPVGVLTVFDIFGSVLSSRSVGEQKVFVSGIDDDTREYETDIRTALDGFMEKAERMKGARALYISVNIKKMRGRMYEMHARLSIEKQGTVYVHATDYNIERTLNQLLGKLMKEIKRKKERTIAVRKVTSFKKGMDEVRYYEES